MLDFLTMKRREFPIELYFNDILILKVIIDTHYEKKHSVSFDDKIILELVKQLNGKMIVPDAITKPYSYFKQVLMELNGKFYRLIWLLEENQIYIGVVNAHRR